MGSGDGTILGSSKVLDNGPDNQRLNIVLVAEGFQAGQQGDFDTLCNQFVTALQAEAWYPIIGIAINVHKLNVASTDAGADDPVACGDGSVGAGTTVNTYFDAAYCTSGLRRCLGVDWFLVSTTLTPLIPQWHAAAVLVNSTQRGGCAQPGLHVFATAISTDWKEVVLHEMGHAAFGLADEYGTWQGCGSGETDHNNAPAGEPIEPNVTLVTNRATLKWRHLVHPEVPVPTMQNPDCGQCDPNPNVLPDEYQIGLFEGARYFHCGLFRPAFNCRMRDSTKQFCPVCLEAIADRLSTFMAPTPQLQVVTGDGSLLLDFGDVAYGLTMYRSFEVRNVRAGFPGKLHVTLSPPTGSFTYAPGTETSFTLPEPILDPFTSRPVFVAFTSTSSGGPTFNGDLQVTTPDDPIHPSIMVDLTAHAVPPPPVDSVLIIDRSGSMSDPTGIPGQTKMDLAIVSANLYVSLLKDNDRIGLVRFNDVSGAGDVLVGLTVAGASPGGAGRMQMQSALNPGNLSPAGNTSIGAGLLRGSLVLDGGVANSRALVVLTDGIQNTPPDIATARAAITPKMPRQRVFAVGLGLNQLQDSLVQIASVTNGVAQITGDLVGYKEFLLQKLYVQILTDVSDEAFVKDPRGVVPTRSKRSTEILIGEIDVAADFILVYRASPFFPKYMRFWLEAPDGTIVNPADAAPLPNVDFFAGPGHMVFRWLFPAFPDRPKAHVGRWLAWVENWGREERPESTLYYSVMCKARSDLRLGGHIIQKSYDPGSPMTVVLEPTLFGQPVALAGRPQVQVRRPDNTPRTLTLDPDPFGAYRADFLDTGLTGPYHFSTEVTVTTPAGFQVTRFRQMTGLIFRGQDSGHNGGSGNGGSGNGTGLDPRCCAELKILFQELEKVVERCCREEGHDPDCCRAFRAVLAKMREVLARCCGGSEPALKAVSSMSTENLLEELRRRLPRDPQ